jgi:hypothetical protein
VQKFPLTFRIDVDYAYPSRTKSFLYTYFNKHSSNRYLEYSKLLANFINLSRADVKAYWFFNPKTFPDETLLKLLDNDKHEIGLHVINDPLKELEALKAVVKKNIRYYTIHGTSRLLGQIVWHRKLGQKQAVIPEGFPLKSFHDYPTCGIDSLCYIYTTDNVLNYIMKFIKKYDQSVISIHPEWLLCRGRINHRGPYVEVLRSLLFAS